MHIKQKPIKSFHHTNNQYYTICKPFGMLSQFTREGAHATLADLEYNFPKDVYPVGRLDANSEGLLILTNDTSLNGSLLNPKNAHLRTYLVQVEGVFSEQAASQLGNGVTININGQPYKTGKAYVEQLTSIPNIFERVPPVRFRKSIPTSWIKISLSEGKNHQVRKMTAHVGFPTLRLVRIAIESLQLHNLLPGEVKSISASELATLLKLSI